MVEKGAFFIILLLFVSSAALADQLVLDAQQDYLDFQAQADMDLMAGDGYDIFTLHGEDIGQKVILDPGDVATIDLARPGGEQHCADITLNYSLGISGLQIKRDGKGDFLISGDEMAGCVKLENGNSTVVRFGDNQCARISINDCIGCADGYITATIEYLGGCDDGGGGEPRPVYPPGPPPCQSCPGCPPGFPPVVPGPPPAPPGPPDPPEPPIVPDPPVPPAPPVPPPPDPPHVGPPVPEPGTATLAIAGALMLLLGGKKKK